MLDCDNGSYDAWYWAHPPVYMPSMCNLTESEIIKNYVHIPVVCAGKMDSLEESEDAVRQGKCDAIGLARAFLVDPDLVNKYASGESKSIKPCIGCHSGCLNRVGRGKSLSCALNPRVLREKEFYISEGKGNKRVAIVGAGISGIELAILLQEHGYDVKVYEKSSRIGGNFNYAASFSFKNRDKRLLEWYREKASRLKICYNYEIKAADIESLDADIVVIAVGCIPRPKIFKNNSIRVEDYLANHEIVKDIPEIVIIGAGLTGIETALELSMEGHYVHLIDKRDDLFSGDELCDANRLYLQQALKYKKVDLHLGIIQSGESNEGFWVSDGNNNIVIATKKYIIIEATGYIHNTGFENIKVNEKRFFKIGDSNSISNVYNAVNDAYTTYFNILKEA